MVIFSIGFDNNYFIAAPEPQTLPPSQSTLVNHHLQSTQSTLLMKFPLMSEEETSSLGPFMLNFVLTLGFLKICPSDLHFSHVVR